MTTRTYIAEWLSIGLLFERPLYQRVWFCDIASFSYTFQSLVQVVTLMRHGPFQELVAVLSILLSLNISTLLHRQRVIHCGEWLDLAISGELALSLWIVEQSLVLCCDCGLLLNYRSSCFKVLGLQFVRVRLFNSNLLSSCHSTFNTTRRVLSIVKDRVSRRVIF